MTTGNKMMWKRGEIANFSSFPHYFQNISIFRSQIAYSFVKCGCLIYLLSSVLQTWYVEIRIYRSISESPLDFEITTVDCIMGTCDMCGQRKLNSAYTCAVRSKFSLSAWETLHPWLSEMRPVKVLIRLRECAGWSESSLGAHFRKNVFCRCG